MTPTPAYATSQGQGATGDDAGILEQTQDKLGQVADQAQQSAGQVTEQVKQRATSQLESQKDRAVDSLVTVAQALRQTGQHLHEQKQDGIAGYVEQAAERVETLTNHVRARDVPQLLNDTEELARRKPALFLGGALALGFVGARFLMSSGQRARAQRGYELSGQTAGSGSAYAQSGSAYLQSGAPYGQPSSPYAQPGSAYGQPSSPSARPGAQSSALAAPPSAVYDSSHAGTQPGAGGIDSAPGTPVA